MNWAYVYQIAKHELTLLGRNWAFRVYALLGLSGIFLFHAVCQSTWGVYSWSMVALSSSIPHVNAFLFCLLQAFFMPFVVLDLWTRERHVGTLDSIRVHPESNREYLLGKFLGICFGFLFLSLFVMLLGMLVNGLASNAPFSFPVYMFYWFTLTLPSAVFMLGLSFFLVFALNNRWASLFLLMVFFVLTVSVLPGKRWDIFNFLATHQSNLFSPLMGHVDLTAYLLHRICFLLCGAGFLFLATCFSRRLFNKLSSPRALWLSGGVLLFAGFLAGWLRDTPFREEQSVRDKYRSIYLRHEKERFSRVTSHDIVFSGSGDSVSLSSRLVVWNPTSDDESRVVLYLNPFLRVNDMRHGERPVEYNREGQMLEVDVPVPAGDSVVLFMEYSGKIDERVCYLDVPDRDYYNTSRFDAVYHWGRRYAFTGDDFTLLLPECLWYPVTVPPVCLSTPIPVKNFTHYRLRVKNAGNRTVLSQGIAREEGGDWCFDTKRPLEGISLCVGYYSRKSVLVKDFPVRPDPYSAGEGVQVFAPFVIEWYHFEGHDFLTGSFTASSLKEVRSMIEETVGNKGEFDYPFDRLRFVETPLAFTSYFRLINGKSELVQPEMVFYPEFGASLDMLSDFRQAKKELLAREWRGLVMTEKLGEGWILESMVRELLNLWSYDDRNNSLVTRLFCSAIPKTRGKEVSCFPLLKVPEGHVNSEDYPMLDIALKRVTQRIMGMNLNIPGDVRDYLEDKSLEDAVHDPGIDPVLLNSIIEQKGVVLANYICWHGVKFDDFYYYLKNYYRERPREIPLEELVVDIKTDLGVDLMPFLPEWYRIRGLPCFLIKDFKYELLREPFPARSRTSFKVYNSSACGGFLAKFMGSESPEKIFYIPGGQCKAISIVGFGGEGLYFGLSRNKPGEYNSPYAWASGVQSTWLRTSDTTSGVHDISPEEFLASTGEIVVDNEDPGFHLEGNSLGWVQRVLGRQERIPEFADINRVEGWAKFIMPCLHGDVVRSAFYRSCGRGKYKAVWETELPEPGMYDVQVYVVQYKPAGSDIDTHMAGTLYHYTIETGDGASEEVDIDITKEKLGWVSIGKFNFSGGKAKVILDDRGPSSKHFIVADAVKWVKK